MGFSFDRPVGPGADVLELEYVSALMQTDVDQVRGDASLTAEDVAFFLSSRYGVLIRDDEVAERLLKDFTITRSKDKEDTGNNNNNTVLDLMEFVSLLLIPRLRRDESDDKNLCFSYVLDMLLHDTIGGPKQEEEAGRQSQTGVEITTAALQRMFRCLGEIEVAEDILLLEAMVELVKCGKEKAILNTETFKHALVCDLQAFDPSTAHKIQTNFADICGASSAAVDEVEKETNESDPAASGDLEKSNGQSPKPIKFAATFPWMDFAADTYRSRALVVMMWIFFALSFFTYYSGIGTFIPVPECKAFQFRATWADNLGSFGCTIGWAVARWLYIVAVMGAYGIMYFMLTGIGNGAETRNPLLPTLGAAFGLAFSIFPLFVRAFDRSNKAVDSFLKVLTTVFGLLVVLLNLWATFSMITLLLAKANQRLVALVTPGAIQVEARIKLAGVKKTDKIVENALRMHVSKDTELAIESHLGQALLNYARMGNTETERVGGVRWTFRKIWSRELFTSEGLSVSGRLLSINVSQFLLSFFILAIGLVATVIISAEYSPPEAPIEELFTMLFDLVPGVDNIANVIREVSQTTSNFLVENIPTSNLNCSSVEDISNCTLDTIEQCREAAGNWLCAVFSYTSLEGEQAAWRVQEGLLSRAGFSMNAVSNTTFDTLLEATTNSVSTLYPTEKYMIFVPLLFATVVAFITALTVAVAVIPSATTTTMKLRCGLIELMHDPKQKTIRIAPDQVAYIRGAMLWGILFSAGLMGIVIGGFMFLLLWQNTSIVVQRLIAVFIGIIIVITLHWVFVRSCRFITSKAFYRRRVRTANLVLLAREAAFFALSIGFTIVRVGKIILITILFVGRIDIPFLNDGIGELEVLGYRLDNHPYIFAMDCLQHEAHRHPLIESFGVISLLKLQLGEMFVTRAGSAWRLLYVLMLMPWLTRYRRLTRVATGETVENEQALFEYRNLKQSKGAEREEDKDQMIEDLQRQNRLLRAQLTISRATQQDLRRRSTLKRRRLEL